MGDTQHSQPDQGAKLAAQKKLMESVITALRDNHDALPFLPEMIEQFIEMYEAGVGKKTGAHNVDVSRDDEEKVILGEREKNQLKSKVESQEFDLRKKDERIQALTKTVEEKDKYISLLKKQNGGKLSKDDSDVDWLSVSKEKDDQLSEQAEKISSLKAELATKKETATQEDKDRDLISNIELKNKHIEEQNERYEELKEKAKAVISTKENEIDQLKSRIAFLSEKRIKQDQSKVEDILSKNRQSKLEEEFSQFVDGPRVEACDRIQYLYGSKEEIDVHVYYPRLACLIFEAAFERMKEAKDDLAEVYKEITSQIIRSAPEQSRYFTICKKNRQVKYDVKLQIQVQRQEAQYITDVLDALMLILKETAYDCNLHCFEEDVRQIIGIKWQMWLQTDKHCRLSLQRNLLVDPKITVYMKQCIRLAWRMVTQVPAMKIEYQSLYLDGIHRKKGDHPSPSMRTKRDSYPGEEIACYLWPALWDGGGRLVHKGEVLCKMKHGK